MVYWDHSVLGKILADTLGKHFVEVQDDSTSYITYLVFLTFGMGLPDETIL